MGHHSNNLIDLPEMSSYAGAIFSPVNCNETEAVEQIVEARTARKNFEIIFDPQLYVPASERGKLQKWAYFPKDVDSADVSSSSWWSGLNKKLVIACQKVRADSVCSPVVIPKVFDDKFYSTCTKAGNELLGLVKPLKVDVLQTLLVNAPQLTSNDRSLEIASIISQTDATRIYLVIEANTSPRREFADENELLGVMKLINALERNGVEVLVAFCSSELLLWKAAGARSCASGKFFNLRRFSRQRFEGVSAKGGGQMPYWFEEGLLAFLRQDDLRRIRNSSILSAASLSNPFGRAILANLDEAWRNGTKPASWLGNSWRHFLYWFADVEGRLSRSEVTPESLLATADANWSKLDKEKSYMLERENNGVWVRAWMNALNGYTKSKG
jgi:hypothetical protein